MPEAKFKIHPEIAHLAVPMESLHTYPGNPRVGNLALIAESLQENGQYKPIVVNRGTHTGRPNEILAGNNTYLAALSLEWSEIAATFVDVDEARGRKILLLDNKANDVAGYDHEALAAILAEVGQQDLIGTGYTLAEAEKILDAAELPAEIDLPSTGSGTGTTGHAEALEWGYLRWQRTTVQITSDEVEGLNRALKRYVAENGTDVGFGFSLLGDDEEDDDASGEVRESGGDEDKDER